jgi:hypothetical protein
VFRLATETHSYSSSKENSSGVTRQISFSIELTNCALSTSKSE